MNIKKMINRLIQMVKQAYISNPTNDASVYPITQISYNGKTSNALRMSPYGVCSNPPEKSNVLLISANAQESLKFAFIDDMPNRFKNLIPGEVKIGHYGNDTFIYFKDNSDIEIYSSNDVNIVGDTTINITTNTVNIKATTINIDGNISLSGNINATGSFTVSGDCTIGGKSFLNHTHGGVQTGSGSTGVPE